MVHPLLKDATNWTLRCLAEHRLLETPERPFLHVIEGPTQTYGEFISCSAALANFLLGRGVAKGSCVAMFCRPGLAPLQGWLAAGLIGAIDVTINPAFRGEVLAYPLRTTRPTVVIVDVDLLPVLMSLGPELDSVTDVIVVGAVSGSPLAAFGSAIVVHVFDDALETRADLPEATIAPGDPSTVMFTSGTTGPSKAALLPNGQVILIAQQALGAIGLTDDDTYYCAHPLNHIAGKFMGVLATFLAGGQLVLDQRFNASTWLMQVRRHGVTASIAHGPMIEMIFKTPPTEFDRSHRLARLMCCPLPKGIGPAFEERFGLRGVEMWGMTEIGCPLWTDLETRHPQGSCGRLLDEWYELDVVDPLTDETVGSGRTGEFVVRPKQPFTTMLGYLGRPDATVEAWRNLWFHTGDAGYRDDEGYYYFVDRIRDRIRRRAENISSFDIEMAALKFPGVAEVAAVGVPSGMEGDDDIMLNVVLAKGESLNEVALIRFMLEALPHFMVPRYIELHDALPRTPTNKVRKRELAAMGVRDTTWDRHKAGISLKKL
ncbi:AMP-binding protein [Aureimonas jatrophae]|uniref:Crotonobetaine/carnitine-CoA ligase n=1 Tax=Aureimonas jatrophae TaxID=1166073 RepID=A0A1H0EGY1_9HYPH|nr:AMP-binding protein [Aureimonas jatrophae]MBB3952843.1 crotonobetaine/carnitine-CoA ligase [Aureimonas jatrophae]SDN81526.1 crotonobetaine/carnitine-CoA ligase [Aureimonas jatrophae]